MARIKKDRVKDIAARVVRRPQPKRTPVIVRTGRKDAKTPARKDLNLRAAELTAGGPLTRSKFNQLCEELPAQNLKINFVHKQLKGHR